MQNIEMIVLRESGYFRQQWLEGFRVILLRDVTINYVTIHCVSSTVDAPVLRGTY